MAEFELHGKTYQNPVELALDKIGGKWKMPILWQLKDQTLRYGELRKCLPRVTHNMLTQQLRELEQEGFIHREVYPEVPPKVEYSITEQGLEAIPAITVLHHWGMDYLERQGVDVQSKIEGQRHWKQEKFKRP